MTFRLAENYPVDLYYLMDLSNSMADDKEKLAALGNKIGLYHYCLLVVLCSRLLTKNCFAFFCHIFILGLTLYLAGTKIDQPLPPVWKLPSLYTCAV